MEKFYHAICHVMNDIHRWVDIPFEEICKVWYRSLDPYFYSTRSLDYQGRCDYLDFVVNELFGWHYEVLFDSELYKYESIQFTLLTH